MSRIRILPDSLASKIAAGEVVERPASIVKELIENSIDAGSTRVDVAVESGGRRLIRVSDDGEGMVRDDALLAFERHATSKLQTPEQLSGILTLGFRGEALASIASVAKVRLRTQAAGDLAGTEIEIHGGRILKVRDIAFSKGTELEIRDLFFSVPARRKFLRSEATEGFHIANLVTHYALAHPNISMTLINNERETIAVTPVATLRERAYQLFGDRFIGDLIEVNRQDGEMRVRGFVSSPSATRSNRDSQFFFVNRRYVRDRLLARALSESYRAMMPSGCYPSAMLFVEVPPADVDVNVHPAKTEVRFLRVAIVGDMVRDAVRSAIGTAKAAATPFGAARNEPMPVREQPEAKSFTPIHPPLPSSLPPSLDELRGAFRLQAPSTTPPVEQPSMHLSFAPAPAIEPPASAVEPTHRTGCLGTRAGDGAGSLLKPAENISLSSDEINPLGQLNNSFIVAVDRLGMLLIDQHVAHERILFEQHWSALKSKRIDVQRLLLPETLDLTPAQAAGFDQLLPELEENGFELSRLSGRTVAINALPALLPAGASQSLLTELLDAIEKERRGLSMDELRSEIAASLACRAAIKINTPLTSEKMRWLIDRLLVVNNPATCPHGRPIVLRITQRDIERGFQR
jgi:DNA mismatch repair protein MutL